MCGRRSVTTTRLSVLPVPQLWGGLRFTVPHLRDTKKTIQFDFQSSGREGAGQGRSRHRWHSGWALAPSESLLVPQQESQQLTKRHGLSFRLSVEAQARSLLTGQCPGKQGVSGRETDF